MPCVPCRRHICERAIDRMCIASRMIGMRSDGFGSHYLYIRRTIDLIHFNAIITIIDTIQLIFLIHTRTSVHPTKEKKDTRSSSECFNQKGVISRINNIIFRSCQFETVIY